MNQNGAGRLIVSEMSHRTLRLCLTGALILTLSGCGSGGFGGLFTRRSAPEQGGTLAAAPQQQRDSTIWDLFTNADNPNITVEVNKYLWNASLEILNFLPVESVDPFTGVIVTGFGTPPGGGRAYRATILVNDPALDARSLKVALVARGGSVSSETVRAVEDAILTRARQLRIQDSRF